MAKKTTSTDKTAAKTKATKQSTKQTTAEEKEAALVAAAKDKAKEKPEEEKEAKEEEPKEKAKAEAKEEVKEEAEEEAKEEGEIEEPEGGYNIPKTYESGAEGKVTAGFETSAFLPRFKGFFERIIGVEEKPAEPAKPVAPAPTPIPPETPEEPTVDFKITVDPITISEEGGGLVTFTIAINGYDTVLQPGETASVVLSVVKVDADGQPQATAGGSDADYVEEATVNLNNMGLPTGVTFNLLTGTLTFNHTANLNNQISFTIELVDDQIPELVEDVVLQLTNAQLTSGTATISIDIAEVDIIDDDVPTIDINDISLTEGGPADTFTVTLTQPAIGEVTVDWVLVLPGVSAQYGAEYDYTGPTSGSVTIAAGDISAEISVSPDLYQAIADGVYDPNETFTVNLTNVTGMANIGDGEGIATIEDTTGEPTIDINDIALTEGGAPDTFTVTLSHPSSEAINVSWDLVTPDISAEHGVDYTGPTSGTVTIAAGATTAEISIPSQLYQALEDGIYDPDETFTVNLTSVTSANANIGDGEGIATITDIEGPPTISINDITLYEEGETSATFEISLSHPTNGDVTINWSRADVSAEHDADYTGPTSGSVTIPAGETTATVTGPEYTAIDDNIYEPGANETFNVEITAVSGGGLSMTNVIKNIGVGEIVDNEEQPSGAGFIIINEIGLGVGTSFVKGQGNDPDVTEGERNFIELYRADKQGAVNANLMNELTLEIIGQDGTKTVIHLIDADGLPALSARSFLTVYDNGTWATSKVGGGGLVGDVNKTGTYVAYDGEGNLLDVIDWNLGDDTSAPIGVNLYQTEMQGQTVTNIGSLDVFVANGVESTDPAFTGNPSWEGPAFDGTTNDVHVFGRVFDDGPNLGNDAYPPDSDRASDWTSSEAPTERAYNDSSEYYEPVDVISEYDYATLGDTNPDDPTDDLDPNQAAGTNEADAGQTILTGTAGDDILLAGGAGPDLISGGEGEDTIIGEGHNDRLEGGPGDDTLEGGPGADELTGGPGVDTFEWKSGDEGTAGSPVADTVTDFELGSGGDVLELGDMLGIDLTGATTNAAKAAIIDDYLHFEANGGKTTISVDTTGTDPSDPGNQSQQIVLDGVASGDWTTSPTTDAEYIEELLDNSQLEVES